jgi:predicted permease
MMIDSLFQDIRYAMRTLGRAPLFAGMVAATMGLGLGLLGSVFTVLNAYLLKPVDLPDPYALYSVSWDTDDTRGHRFRLTDYEAIESEGRHLAAFAAAQDVTVMQDAISTQGLLVTGNYFEMLRARPALGRLLRRDDAATRGGLPVVVLSHEAWRSRHDSDPSIVGQQISLGRQRFEVVGIAEPHAYLSGQEFVSFWAPLTMAGAFPVVDPWAEPNAASLVVLGRLREGVSAASLGAWLDLWLRQRFPPPSDLAPVAVRTESLARRVALDTAVLTLLVLLMSAFGLVLLVACANVANMMLARALIRQPEIAVRFALGATRWRVARQLVIESLVLAVPGAAAGLALIIVTARAFPSAIMATFPPGFLPVENLLVPLDPDWRVIALLIAAAVVSAVLITLAPAGRLARVQLSLASRGQASPDVHRSRLRSGLVAMQIGACALFLVGATGLIDASSRLASPQFNLSFDRVSLIRVDSKVRAAVATRLTSEPAVEHLAAASRPPMMGALSTTQVTASATRIAQNTGYTVVSPDYFNLFGIGIVRGRTFTPAEGVTRAPVAVVSQGMAAALWPGRDPLGETLELDLVRNGRPDPRLPADRVQVIGVAENVANGSILDGIDESWIYFPTNVQALANMTLLVKARSRDLRDLESAVARAVKEIAPDIPFQVSPMPTVLAGALWTFEAFSAGASLLGLVALLFAYSGTHGVVSFLAAQRRREIGVRMALGATPWRIIWGMLLETSRTASLGLVAGLVLAAGLIRLVGSFNAIIPDFGVRPFFLAAVIVLIATAIAALLPLGGAARIAPAQALRPE